MLLSGSSGSLSELFYTWAWILTHSIKVEIKPAKAMVFELDLYTLKILQNFLSVHCHLCSLIILGLPEFTILIFYRWTFFFTAWYSYKQFCNEHVYSSRDWMSVPKFVHWNLNSSMVVLGGVTVVGWRGHRAEPVSGLSALIKEWEWGDMTVSRWEVSHCHIFKCLVSWSHTSQPAQLEAICY